MRKLLWLAMLLAGVVLGGAAQAEERVVLVGTIEGVINPITAQYVDRVVSLGESRGVAAVLFQINTPGGLSDSTFHITGRFLNATVPVIVYVAPPGARAASAGTFITMAGHIAAMAQATNIGAAHPVDASGGDIQGDLRAKVENDAVAAATKIAKARGRNEQWAEDAVRKSVSIRDDQAVELKVVDVQASDVADVLRKASGRTVQLPAGPVTLQTAGLATESADPNPIESFLHVIVDPQIAALMFTLGTWGLIFELGNPGLIFPGIIGVVAIVLALFSLGTLDANAAGLALLVFAVVLFALEVKVASHGMLTIGGVVALVLGFILLFPPWTPTLPGFRLSIDPLVIGAVSLFTAAFFVLVIRAALEHRTLPVTVGAEALRGAIGVAESDLGPSGVVRVEDEEWSATSAGGPIAKGQRVRVRAVDSVRLIVEPAENAGQGRGAT
jgi:membrane-bound serine protease (ClpP class)